MLHELLIKDLRATAGFVERNFNLIKRYLGWEIVFMVYTIVNTITIGLIGVTSGDPQKVVFLIIGALLWGFLSIIFHEVAECISWERWEGTIEFTFMAPAKRITYLFGMCTYAVIYGLIRSAIVLLFIILFFKIELNNVNVLSAVTIVIVSSFSFIGMGLIAAVFPLLSPEKGSQATHIFQAIILLISGVYYPISVLPGWMQKLAFLSPATYTLRAVRAAVLEGAPIGTLINDVVILVILGIVLIPLGYLIFSLGEKHAKTVGKLNRNG
ncbi:MAG: ABC transporter permease [bacterium]|nr:ABC transporter permease [bacterium]